jgi:hypothetical protein
MHKEIVLCRTFLSIILVIPVDEIEKSFSKGPESVDELVVDTFNGDRILFTNRRFKRFQNVKKSLEFAYKISRVKIQLVFL